MSNKKAAARCDNEAYPMEPRLSPSSDSGVRDVESILADNTSAILSFAQSLIPAPFRTGGTR